MKYFKNIKNFHFSGVQKRNKMDIPHKTTSDQTEIDNDSLAYQKENTKQKSKRGRRKKIRTPNQHVIYNQQNYINEFYPNCADVTFSEDQAHIFNYRNEHSSFSNEHFDKFIQRRECIMAQLQKDQMQVMNPHIIPFQSREHAIDSLSSYHIFSQPSHDDLVFDFSPRYTDLFNDIQCVTESLRNTLDEHDKSINQNIVVDLLLTEEQKYIVTKYNEYLKNKKKKLKMAQKQTTPKPVKPARPSPRIRKEDRLKVKLKTSEIKPTSTIAVLRLLQYDK